MIELLKKIIPENRIKARYIDLVSFAADAGFYHLLPKAVVQPVTEEEIILLFQFSQQHTIPLVFRTGGTSLSGQSVTDGILVDLSQHWNKIKVEDNGDLVRVQPGITGAMVNTYLKKYNKKIGPDPSSISAAMMGGILSNNASGMCCGVKLNSYHTTKFIRFILPDGKIFSTENQLDYDRFEKECAPLFNSLLDIKSEVHQNEPLYKKIRIKYQIKNTVGYSLNAFIDHEHPLDILAHLLIGAEGTLAFIAEALLQTTPDYPFKSTALLYFPTIGAACEAIMPLNNAGASMVELMDRASLRAVENLSGMPAIVKSLPETAAALLIEFQENSWTVLEERVSTFLLSTAILSLYNAPVFTSDTAERDFLWKVRKGLFPAVGAVRASGTTVILEDIVFPVEKLGNAIADLQKLFKRYEYTNAIIFGHAKDGNIHFVITQSFDTPQQIKRYDLFMREVINLVVKKYDGSLKAEHGTGRNMAPFVETEWGSEAYTIMKKIKQAIDPHLLLNPGVIINEDKNVHLKNLKQLPPVEEEVDKCIECGYCEHICPSRNITTTPRRRIVIRRALKKLQLEGETAKYELLLSQSKYDVLDTCAVDGLCATACPVDINTGELVKRLRMENHSAKANKFALFIAKHFKLTEQVVRVALKMGVGLNKLLGKNTMTKLTGGVKKMISAMPLWSAQINNPPHSAILKNSNPITNLENAIVYFPACISRMLGTYEGKKKNILQTFISICNKSGIEVKVLNNVSGSCCGQIFSSKGFKDAAGFTANSIVENLWKNSNSGHLNIVIDVSSCAYTLHHLRPILTHENKQKFDQLTILDSVDFLYHKVMSTAIVKHKKNKIVLHPVCSLEKMNTTPKFIHLAKHFAMEVLVPKNTGCCGMAGDRGFLFPEITDAATRPEANEVIEQEFDGYYSSTKTCEMAMSDAVKTNYESILYLVDEAI
ncbi:FAD-binding and (Fe-S)-binding domain-containing protein [Ferruginibacter sp.]|uniref:FAD-binding and (Fe-S)-binding domain-containing protein n=1 Tax=Ferruginibacter sp. TaxID=1940288 RepID=UPI00265912F1|nr:FAD-binding and (Fe-S)-binding domain-containing protein [Ferruginibacter sp.]